MPFGKERKVGLGERGTGAGVVIPCSARGSLPWLRAALVSPHPRLRVLLHSRQNANPTQGVGRESVRENFYCRKRKGKNTPQMLPLSPERGVRGGTGIMCLVWGLVSQPKTPSSFHSFLPFQ